LSLNQLLGSNVAQTDMPDQSLALEFGEDGQWFLESKDRLFLAGMLGKNELMGFSYWRSRAGSMSEARRRTRLCKMLLYEIKMCL